MLSMLSRIDVILVLMLLAILVVVFSIAGREMTDILSLGGLLLVIGVARSGLGSLGASNGRGAIVKSGEASLRAL